MTIPYIHGLCQSIHRVLSSLAIKVTFRPLQTSKSCSIQRTPFQNGKGNVWCTVFPAMSVREPTLDRLAGHWTIALQSIGGLTGMGMWRPRHWQSMCLLLGTKWIYLRPQHAQTHCLLESWHIQHEQTALNRGREFCQDSMLPCWTDIVLCFYYILFYIVFKYVHM